MKIKVKHIIDTADRRIPGNAFTVSDKVSWLRSLVEIWREFEREIGARNPEELDEEQTLGEEFNGNPKDYYEKMILEMPESREEMYIIWLVMKMHFYNGEVELYNNAAEAFSILLQKAKREYIRTNRPNNGYSFRGHKEV